MGERTQTSRQIAIATSLGDDVLLFRHATITEYLGRMFQMEVDVFSSESFKFSDIVGQNATIRLEQQDGNMRYFNGYVTRIMHTGGSERVAHYRLTLSPWLWFLTRTSDCRIFQKMNVPDIIMQVFRDEGFTDFSDENLHGTYTEREYCVQYRETDFNFVSRLMEEEGIYFYFKHEDGKHTMMLCDSSASHQAYPGYEKIPYYPPDDAERDQEYIWDWQMEQEVQPGRYAVTDYNMETPDQDLSNTSTMTREYATPDFEMFDYHPGRYKESGDAETLSKIRLDEYQAFYEVIRGEGDARGMSCGATFQIEGFSDSQDNKEHLVTSVVHELESDEYSSQDDDSDAPAYECTFTAILGSQQFRPKRITPKPVVCGPQTAFVTGPSGEEIHVDEFGRVKVQFHWDRAGAGDDTSSCWIRVGQIMAGKTWGFAFWPRVGQEVIVSFLEGDPDQPLITGVVYNADNMPPFALPDNKTQSGIKTNSSKGGGGTNTIRFEDKKGEEQLFLFAQHNMDVRVKNDKYETVVNDRHLVVGDNKFEHVKKVRNEIVDEDHNEQIGKTYHLDIGDAAHVKVKKSYYLQCDGDVVEIIKAGRSTSVQGNFEVTSEASIIINADTGIDLYCGDNGITIDSNGVTIKASKVVIDSSAVKIASGPGSSPSSPDEFEMTSISAPKDAIEAASIDPGEDSKVQAKKKEKEQTKLDSAKVAPSEGEESEAKTQEVTWVAIVLKDDKGNPIPDEPYKVKAPDGRIYTGTVDAQGKARVDGIPPGNCEITFPRLHKTEWRKA